MRLIIETFGVRSFNFQDDTFTLDRRRMRELLGEIGKLGVTFKCHGKAGHDTREDYQRLRDAGCVSISWGIESGSQMMLDRMRKNARVGDCENVIAWAKETGMTDRVFLMVGFPGETRETIEETKRFIERTDPSQYFVSTFQPYPGTDVSRHPDRYGVTRMYKDYRNYLQVYGANQGGYCNIDTDWASRREISQLDIEFRKWISRRRRRGYLQDYEMALEADEHSVEESSAHRPTSNKL
jgi:radical SAM superfamily enzyme YgiQ (UPF0313 family)